MLIRKRYFILCLLGFMGLSLALPSNNAEQLVIFINSQTPILTTSDMEALKDLTSELEVALKVVEVKKGVPKEVVYTPSIFFQNYNGRSLYYGRYKNLSRLKNFIRSARLAHQQTTDNIKQDILTWQKDQTTITAPLKITELSGSIPSNFDQAAFIKSAKQATAKQMQHFQQLAELNLARNTRSFYLNLYPYLDESGTLTISAEIFSQYNCVKPICQKYDDGGVVSGKWSQRERLFAEAGALMEKEIIQQMEKSTLGDALAFLPANTPNKTWEDLALTLPKKPNINTNKQSSTKALAQKWVVDMPQNTQDPIIIFSFLAPLDNYVGEVKSLSGTLDLSQPNSLENVKGNFEVQIADVTMGAEDFDYEVQNKMLKMGLFPNSTFTFEGIKTPTSPLEIGKITNFTVEGTFTLLGITIPLDIPATIEPIINEAGTVRLSVNTTFQLPLFDAFKVEGPDGPAPAKDVLQFYMRFYLKAA